MSDVWALWQGADQRSVSRVGEVDAVGWGEYVERLLTELRRDGASRQSVAEAVSAASSAVSRLVEESKARHARVAAMRLAFVRECLGARTASGVPADLPSSVLVSDALRLVAGAHDALRVEYPFDSRVALLAQVRARRQLRAAYDALVRERAERLASVALS
jgi:hypothetical protein